MDMSTSKTMGGAPTDGSTLNASGIDFSNDTQAEMFLGEILVDTAFQVDGNMYARDFWFGVCALIALYAVGRGLRVLEFGVRMRAAAQNKARPASPSNLGWKSIASLTAICREASYAQYLLRGKVLSSIPPIGTIFLIVGYLSWVILLEFVNNNIAGAQHFTSLGVQAGWLAIAQVPLLILLAGKNNLIRLATGISYERLNVVHRWSARILFFLATLHLIFLHLAWNKYGLMSIEYSEDSCIPTGLAVYAILLWMNLSTLAPLRNFSYEFFVVQHILTFFGFIIGIMMHLPDTALYSRVSPRVPSGAHYARMPGVI